MSFTIIEQATPRLHRSELAVPGSNPGLFEKAAASAADIVFLDVEDAVAPDDKEQARKNIIAGLNEINWGSQDHDGAHQRPRHPLHVSRRRRHRGGLPAPRHDPHPEGRVPADVYALDMLVTQIEAAKKRKSASASKC